jgi:hypothetical protein
MSNLETARHSPVSPESLFPQGRFTEQLFATHKPGMTGALNRHTQQLRKTVTAILREKRANGGRRSLRSLLHEIDTSYE